MGAKVGSKLTVIQLKALSTHDVGTSIREEGGIKGKVRSTNKGISVDFSFEYKYKNKKKDIRLGSWPKNDLKEIRYKRNSYRTLLDQNIDPTDEIKLSRQIDSAIKTDQAEIDTCPTIVELFERWREIELINRKDKGQEAERMFKKDVFPIIGQIKAAEVKKVDIVKITNRVLSRGNQRMPKVVLAEIRQMFTFAQEQDIVENNPTATIRKSRLGAPDKPRERVLSDEEIKQLYVATSIDGNLMPSTKLAIWIMLSTCCRIGEICKAKWQDIDLISKVWLIPSENSKNSIPHTIYLSDFAVDLFNELHGFKVSSDWLFPNITKTSHVTKNSISKQVHDRQLEEGKARLSGRSKNTRLLSLINGIWTPHDLRRTGATIMGRLGVNSDVIEKCLNHTEQNRLKRTYQRQTYAEEQKEAWKILGNHLSKILSITEAI